LRNIRQLYNLNLMEGEGVGTSYEYYAKGILTMEFLDNLKDKKILIFGLPGKYGLSADFALLAKNNQVVVVDKNIKKLNTLEKIISSEGIKRIDYVNQNPLAYIQKGRIIFDFLLSSEYLQNQTRTENKIFKKYVHKIAKNVIVFVPNKGNSAHQKISKIKSLSCKELLELIPADEQHDRFIGFIDIPPFPPGLKIKDKPLFRKGKLIGFSLFLFGPLLELWAKLEKFLPKTIKNNYAHMVYAISLFKE